MNYMDIKPSDINNGEGLRVSLWVSGCEHRCKGCHNPHTWNRNNGKPFTEDTYRRLINALTAGIKRGLTIIGGEPLTDYNYPEVLELVKKLKMNIPDLNIWVYTGYYYDELIEQDKTDIFDYIDVLVDGRFEEELKDPDLKWRGSSNQNIWRF